MKLHNQLYNQLLITFKQEKVSIIQPVLIEGKLISEALTFLLYVLLLKMLADCQTYKKHKTDKR